MGKAVISKWRRTRWIDLAFGASTAAVLHIMGWLHGETTTLLQVAGGVGIGLLAFVVTPVSTLLALDPGGVRFRAFDLSQRSTILRAMAWAFVLSLVLLLVVLVGGAVVHPTGPGALPAAVVGVGVASVLATARLFWFFYAALKVRHKDDESPLPGSGPDPLMRRAGGTT